MIHGKDVPRPTEATLPVSVDLPSSFTFTDGSEGFGWGSDDTRPCNTAPPAILSGTSVARALVLGVAMLASSTPPPAGAAGRGGENRLGPCAQEMKSTGQPVAWRISGDPRRKDVMGTLPGVHEPWPSAKLPWYRGATSQSHLKREEPEKSRRLRAISYKSGSRRTDLRRN